MPTAILASNYGNYGSFQNPMNYNDGHNRDLEVKPANLVFNFEQLRRDQPPQIEMRDESPGLYMHRRPQTTTTAAPIYVPEINNFPENKVYENNPFARPTLPPRVNNDHHRQMTPTHGIYNQNLVQSTPMPSPPPAPKWSDFSETFNRQAFPHYESQGPIEQKIPEFNHFQRPQHQPTAPVARPDLFNHDHGRNLIPSTNFYPSTTPENKPHDFGTMRKDLESSRQNIANRGNHKFAWNDLVTEPSWNHKPQMSSTVAPAVQGKNPPPLPTLTPWLDGF